MVARERFELPFALKLFWSSFPYVLLAMAAQRSITRVIMPSNKNLHPRTSSALHRTTTHAAITQKTKITQHTDLISNPQVSSEKVARVTFAGLP